MDRYPEPDLLVRLIPEEDAPGSFWVMPSQLRSQRTRLYIIARCAGSDPVLSWMWAMDMSDEGRRFAREIVDEPAHPDAWYEEVVHREFGPGGLDAGSTPRPEAMGVRVDGAARAHRGGVC